MNKPCLSINDIIQIIDEEFSGQLSNCIKDRLINLVKNKK